MIELIAAFLCGSVLTLTLIAVGVLGWLYSQSRPVKEDDIAKESPYIRPQLPQSLLDLLCEDEGGIQVQQETCHWFNLIVAFVFQELRDSAITKRFVMKKVNKEFAELMFTRTEGRMIEQLTVRDYFLGTSLPTILSAAVVKVDGYSAENPEIQELDVILDVEYTGSCQVAIDADLVFDKAAYVAVELNKVKGKGRLRFSRKQGTHWFFAFMEDPLLELKVSSHFEGRGYPQLSSIIESQIRKWVKRKHTLPAYKIRYKPFFRKFKPQNQLLEVYVHDKKLTVGKLTVSLLECSRLSEVEGACSVYCTLSVGQMPWQPMVHLWKTQWPIHEFVVHRGGSDETIGILYKMVTHEEESGQSSMIVVSKVVAPSAAYTAGVKKGDVLTRVNNVKVTSVKQARRLIKKFKDTSSILITVQRPPAQFTSHFFEKISSSSALATNTGATTTTDGSSAPDIDSLVVLESPQSAGTEITPISMAVPVVTVSAGAESASSQSQSVSRQRSHTTVTSSHLTESIPPIRSSHTPMSSEDERDYSRFSRRRVESDTMSLCGVMGERGGGGGGSGATGEREVEGIGRGEYRIRRPLIQSQSTTDDTRFTSRSLNRGSPSLSFPTPPPDSSPVPTLSSGDVVDLGALSAVVEGVGSQRSGGGARRKSREEPSDQKQTKQVQACRNPVWNQKFRFSVAEDHCYLNVCVWVKLLEDRGNLLIGHVTIPLMDIAMECLHTKSSTHQQRYVLTEAQPARPSASRAAVQATATVSGGSVKKKTNSQNVDKPFAGDILLKFRHSPKLSEKENVDQSSSQQIQDEHVDRHLVPSQDEMPSNHNFSVAEYNGIQKCDICGKLIFSLKFTHVHKCQNCGLKCHKKCMEYCMKEVKCQRREAGHAGDTEQTAAGPDICDDDAQIMQNTSCHRHLDQLERHRRSESFEVVEGPDSEALSYSTADELVVDPEGKELDPEGREKVLDPEGSDTYRDSNPMTEDEQGQDLYDGQAAGKGLSKEGSTVEPTLLPKKSDYAAEVGQPFQPEQRPKGEIFDDTLQGVGGGQLYGMSGVTEVEEEQVTDDDVDGGGEGSDIERLFTPFPDSDQELASSSQGQVQAQGSQSPPVHLKWSSHLPPDQRETAINKRLGDLQMEIDRIHELITNVYDILHMPHTATSEKRVLEKEIERYEEKMAPLKLLMNEMMSELALCLSSSQRDT